MLSRHGISSTPTIYAAVQVVDILIYKGREELEVFFLLCSIAQCRQWSLNGDSRGMCYCSAWPLLQASCGRLYGTSTCLGPAFDYIFAMQDCSDLHACMSQTLCTRAADGCYVIVLAQLVEAADSAAYTPYALCLQVCQL